MKKSTECQTYLNSTEESQLCRSPKISERIQLSPKIVNLQKQKKVNLGNTMQQKNIYNKKNNYATAPHIKRKFHGNYVHNNKNKQNNHNIKKFSIQNVFNNNSKASVNSNYIDDNNLQLQQAQDSQREYYKARIKRITQQLNQDDNYNIENTVKDPIMENISQQIVSNEQNILNISGMKLSQSAFSIKKPYQFQRCSEQIPVKSHIEQKNNPIKKNEEKYESLNIDPKKLEKYLQTEQQNSGNRSNMAKSQSVNNLFYVKQGLLNQHKSTDKITKKFDFSSLGNNLPERVESDRKIDKNSQTFSKITTNNSGTTLQFKEYHLKKRNLSTNSIMNGSSMISQLPSTMYTSQVINNRISSQNNNNSEVQRNKNITKKLEKEYSLLKQMNFSVPNSQRNDLQQQYIDSLSLKEKNEKFLKQFSEQKKKIFLTGLSRSSQSTSLNTLRKQKSVSSFHASNQKWQVHPFSAKYSCQISRNTTPQKQQYAQKSISSPIKFRPKTQEIIERKNINPKIFEKQKLLNQEGTKEFMKSLQQNLENTKKSEQIAQDQDKHEKFIQKLINKDNVEYYNRTSHNYYNSNKNIDSRKVQKIVKIKVEQIIRDQQVKHQILKNSQHQQQQRLQSTELNLSSLQVFSEQ